MRAICADSPAQTDEAAYPAGLQASDFEESPVELAPITEFAEEKTYDVVVVGAGTGGVPAALSALEEGASVAVLQKDRSPSRKEARAQACCSTKATSKA